MYETPKSDLDAKPGKKTRLIPSAIIGGLVASLSGLVIAGIAGTWLEALVAYDKGASIIENHDRLVELQSIQYAICAIWCVAFALGGYCASKRHSANYLLASAGSGVVFLIWWLPIQIYLLKNGLNFTQTTIILLVIPASIFGGYVANKT